MSFSLFVPPPGVTINPRLGLFSPLDEELKEIAESLGSNSHILDPFNPPYSKICDLFLKVLEEQTHPKEECDHLQIYFSVNFLKLGEMFLLQGKTQGFCRGMKLVALDFFHEDSSFRRQLKEDAKKIDHLAQEIKDRISLGETLEEKYQFLQTEIAGLFLGELNKHLRVLFKEPEGAPQKFLKGYVRLFESMLKETRFQELQRLSEKRKIEKGRVIYLKKEKISEFSNKNIEEILFLLCYEHLNSFVLKMEKNKIMDLNSLIKTVKYINELNQF